MTDSIRGYVLRDSEDVESIMVIRTGDKELLHSIARRITRMRDKRLKELGKQLEGELDE